MDAERIQTEHKSQWSLWKELKFGDIQIEWLSDYKCIGTVIVEKGKTDNIVIDGVNKIFR